MKTIKEFYSKLSPELKQCFKTFFPDNRVREWKGLENSNKSLSEEIVPRTRSNILNSILERCRRIQGDNKLLNEAAQLCQAIIEADPEILKTKNLNENCPVEIEQIRPGYGSIDAKIPSWLLRYLFSKSELTLSFFNDLEHIEMLKEILKELDILAKPGSEEKLKAKIMELKDSFYGIMLAEIYERTQPRKNELKKLDELGIPPGLQQLIGIYDSEVNPYKDLKGFIDKEDSSESEEAMHQKIDILWNKLMNVGRLCADAEKASPKPML